MAMIECRECNHLISKSAKACPACGAPKKDIGCLTAMLIVGISLLGFFLLAGSCGGSSSKNRSGSNSTSYKKNEWHHGGTLHSATIGEWKAATFQNKRATAADWLAHKKWKNHLKTPDDFIRIKSKATLLAQGLDTAVKDLNTVKDKQTKITPLVYILIEGSYDLDP